MSIKSRLERLEITSPQDRILDTGKNIKEKIIEFKEGLYRLSGA
jgi:hypothetical protein